jgi:hypothetical protein
MAAQEAAMRIQAQETHSDSELALREMLLHDVYDLPFDQDLLVTCSYCGESGLGIESVAHQPWCVYLDGPVCPEVPN